MVVDSYEYIEEINGEIVYEREFFFDLDLQFILQSSLILVEENDVDDVIE